MDSDVEIRKPFVPLLDDTLFLWRVSTERDSKDSSLLQFTLARHAIMAAAMSVEAAANSCLDVLRPRGKTMDDLEKLTVLGKYDVYLLSRGNGRIMDRGHADVQSISELKSLRDNVVHPKATFRKYTKLSEDCAFRKVAMYSHLGISRDREWSSDDAETVLRKTISFLSTSLLNCVDTHRRTLRGSCVEKRKMNTETRGMKTFLRKEDKQQIASVWTSTSWAF